MAKFIEYEDSYKQEKLDLIRKVESLGRMRGADKMARIKEIDQMFQDDSDTLDMMEMELDNLMGQKRSEAQSRLSEYKNKSRELKETVNREARTSQADDRDGLFSNSAEDASGEVDPLFQTQRSKISAGTARLNAARDEMRDTQDVAAGIMMQLDEDSQKIMNIRRNTARADESLSRSNAIMRRIRNADIKERVILAVFGLVLVALIITAVVFMVK